jgi:hypothetical protein
MVVGLMSLPGYSATAEMLKETSSHFAAENVASFLGRVSKLIDSAFGSAENNEIVQLMSV